MKSRNSLEFSYIALKQRQKSLMVHYDRLAEIKKSAPRRVTFMENLGKRPRPYSEIDRRLEIERSNKALLTKLININSRRTSSPKSKSIRTIRSLNISCRQRKEQQIINENKLLARRIITQKPLIVKKTLDKDFESYKKYSNLVSRKHLLQQNLQQILFPSISKRYVSRTPCPALKKKSHNKSTAPAVIRTEFTLEDDSSEYEL